MSRWLLGLILIITLSNNLVITKELQFLQVPEFDLNELEFLQIPETDSNPSLEFLNENSMKLFSEDHDEETNEDRGLTADEIITRKG